MNRPQTYTSRANAARAFARKYSGVKGDIGGWIYPSNTPYRHGKLRGRAICHGWDAYGQKLSYRGRIRCREAEGTLWTLHPTAGDEHNGKVLQARRRPHG